MIGELAAAVEAESCAMRYSQIPVVQESMFLHARIRSRILAFTQLVISSTDFVLSTSDRLNDVDSDDGLSSRLPQSDDKLIAIILNMTNFQANYLCHGCVIGK